MLARRRALVAAVAATALACTASLPATVGIPTVADRTMTGVLHGKGDHLVIIPARDVESVILLAPATISSPERMAGRKLFITARDDANSAGPRLPGIQAMFDRAPGPKHFVLLEGSLHAQRVLAGPDGARVLREIVAFLR